MRRAQQRFDLGRIQTIQRHLLGLINEVLNYAKLENGTVQFDMAAVRARDALASAEALVEPHARATGLPLAAAVCAEDVVRAGPAKLRQVLVNLHSNTVKFTDRGGRVYLDCEALRRGAAGGANAQVRLTVRDTGFGIPADPMERIFDPFVQVRAGVTRTAEGAGLGLASSRDLARRMGNLTAENTLGVGSTFTLTLPAAAPAGE